MHTIYKVARKFLQRCCIDRSQNKPCISMCPSCCLLCPQFLHRHCIDRWENRTNKSLCLSLLLTIILDRSTRSLFGHKKNGHIFPHKLHQQQRYFQQYNLIVGFHILNRSLWLKFTHLRFGVADSDSWNKIRFTPM